MTEEIKKRGRPRKLDINKPDVQTQVVEIIKEVLITKEIPIESPQLEGFTLYKALKDNGFPQGGIGQNIEDPNSTEQAYIPEVSEVYQAFLLDPMGWGNVRDALCREWIKHKQEYYGNTTSIA